MAVIDFRFRPRTRGYEEQISKAPIRTAEHIDLPEIDIDGWLRKNIRAIAHGALCAGIVFGSYHLFTFAKQLQYNLMILVP